MERASIFGGDGVKFYAYTLPNQVMPFGFDMVRYSLESRGHALTAIDDGKCTALTSIFWGESVYDWLRKTSQSVRDRTIAGGIYATASPAAVSPHCAGVYCGDGEVWDGHSQRCITDGKRPASMAYNTKVPVYTADMALKKTTTGQHARIIELTRGCKAKCAFCQYSWLKPYREADTDAVCRAVAANGNRIRLVTVDFDNHRDADAITRRLSIYETMNLSQDNSFASLRKRLEDPQWTAPGLLRFGLDGQSERIRKAIMKPIGSDEFAAAMIDCSKRGTRRVLLYQIWGMPSETAADAAEFCDTLRKIATGCQPPFALSVCWNAFIPCPQTPLQWAPSSFGRDVRDHDALLALCKMRDGVQITHMPLITGDALISRRVLAVRASTDCARLVHAVAHKNIDEDTIAQRYESITGTSLHGHQDGNPPWDGLVRYDRNRLWRVACRVHNRLGIPAPSQPDEWIARDMSREWIGDQPDMAWQPMLFEDANDARAGQKKLKKSDYRG